MRNLFVVYSLLEFVIWNLLFVILPRIKGLRGFFLLQAQDGESCLLFVVCGLLFMVCWNLEFVIYG